MRLHGAILLFAALAAVGCGDLHSPTFGAGGDGGVSQDADSPAVVTRGCTISVRARAGGDEPDPKQGSEYLSAPFGAYVYMALGIRDADSRAVFEWSLDKGALPAGMELDQRTGELAGTPTDAGTFHFSVSAVSIPLDGIQWVADPLAVTMRVSSACQTDSECVVEDAKDLYLECRDDLLEERDGGVCMVAAASCAGERERFQVRLAEADALPRGQVLRFTGTVVRHDVANVPFFTDEDGGEKGRRIVVSLAASTFDVVPLSPHGAPPELTLFVRLPQNYRPPVEEGSAYLFSYHAGDDAARPQDGTLLVFARPDGGVPPLEGDATRLRAVLAGHSGRVFPRDLLDQCATLGRCGEMPSMRLVPADCQVWPEMACGPRHEIIGVLPLGNATGLGQLRFGGPPALLGDEGSSSLPPYALHLLASDALVGDAALSCAPRGDSYRLSYELLPTDACLLARPEMLSPPRDYAGAILVPDYVKLRVHRFSPAGTPIRALWKVVQPAENALFVQPELPTSGDVTFRAELPGEYQLVLGAEDDVGTLPCPGENAARFVARPASSVYVEMSHAQPGPLELRVAPETYGAKPSRDLLDEGVAAAPGRPAPTWSDGEQEVYPRLVDYGDTDGARLLEAGAGVQVLTAPKGLQGRYRVGVLHRGDIGSGTVPVRIRVVLDRDMDERLVVAERELAPCELWQVGIMDVEADGWFGLSTVAPESVCTPETP